MKILYLLFHGLSPHSGISKKILNQIEGFKAGGHLVSLCHYEVRDNGHRVRMIGNEILEDYGKGKMAPLKKRMCYGAVLRYVQKNRIQFIYVRSFHNANPFTIHLFRQFRKAGIKIVMEIPTFPYDQEYRYLPLSWRAELFIDQCFRKSLARTCDRIVTFSDDQYIFGKETIRISNGVNFKALPLKSDKSFPPDELHLLAVAEIHYWHGYDRIIEGLGLYYKKNVSIKVYLHLVGGIGAVEQKNFDQLIQKYKIAPYIFLYGQKQGKELDELFDQSQFAIGSLGRHRCHIDKIKPLKNREYAARGIPFIYSETDDDFDYMPYVIKAPADDTPISVEGIIHFYQSLQVKPSEIRQSISHLSWQNQMEIVLRQVDNPA